MAANANANNNRNNSPEHVEFSVKAEEDLFLQGSEKTIKRVTAETNYSCLMLKSQRFSSLFRHYAKYHGLRKDELEYYFVSTLGSEDTPEGVHLQRGDTITVRLGGNVFAVSSLIPPHMFFSTGPEKARS